MRLDFQNGNTLNRRPSFGRSATQQAVGDDPRARELAKRIAQRRHVSMTDAVVEALEAEYRRVSAQQSLAERLDAIADELVALAKPGGRDMTKDEVDAMWGHS